MSADRPTHHVRERPGHFGPFGGQYVPETLMPALGRLIARLRQARLDPEFQRELAALQRDYVGRPTPLYHARKLSAQNGGAQLYLKREDLAHTGAHKINNALGQGLLARRMGKQRIIAETGAGQHGVATATVCAMLDLECIVYMGEEDIHRQSLNVFRMKLLGAEVRSVSSGSRTLKDAINEAIRDWVTNVDGTHYIIGSVVGPAPLPDHGARLPERHRPRGARPSASSSWAGCRTRWWPASGAGATPSASSTPSSEDRAVQLLGAEAAGHGVDSGRHAATLVGRARPACCTARAATSCRTSGGRWWRRTASPPASTTPASGRSTPSSRRRGGPATWRITDDDGDGGLPAAVPHRGDHPRAGVGARRSPRGWSWRGPSVRSRRCWSICPAGGTRTWARWPSTLGSRPVSRNVSCGGDAPSHPLASRPAWPDHCAMRRCGRPGGWL